MEMTIPSREQQISFPGFKLGLKTSSNQEAREVDFKPPGVDEPALQAIGLNTARLYEALYEAFAEKDTSRYATFEDGVTTHCVLDEILANVV